MTCETKGCFKFHQPCTTTSAWGSFVFKRTEEHTNEVSLDGDPFLLSCHKVDQVPSSLCLPRRSRPTGGLWLVTALAKKPKATLVHCTCLLFGVRAFLKVLLQCVLFCINPRRTGSCSFTPSNPLGEKKAGRGGNNLLGAF
jgi:hypothetical protein